MSARLASRFIRPLAIGGMALGITLQMALPAMAQEPAAGVVRMKDPAGRRAGLAIGDMTYHGGPVQHLQKVFTIFWIPGSTFPAGYQSTINQFIQDLSGSSFYGVAGQYADTLGPISPTVLFGGTWLDTSNAFPETALSFGDLLAEVNRAKLANGWTSDSNSYFQVYTPTGITSAAGGGLCGLHWFANPAIGQILFPQSGCFPGGPYPNGSIVDAAINTSSHEIFETVTDPLGTAWFFQNASGEIGDLCNFNFGPRGADGSNVYLSGRPYIVQQEWSNALSGCAMPPSLSLTANGAAGAVRLPAAGPLQIAIAARAGTVPGFANPSDVYVGVSAPFGVLFINSSGFVPAVVPLFHGPLASFEPSPLVNIPDVSTMPRGTYLWFVVVNGSTGTFLTFLQTTTASP